MQPTLRLILPLVSLANNLSYTQFKTLRDSFSLESSVISNPQKEIYTPLITEINQCLPSTIFSIHLHQIWILASLILLDYSMEEQKQMQEFLGTNQDMKDRLTIGFGNLAIRQYSHFTRAQENSSYTNLEQPTDWKKQRSPESPSLSVELLDKLSNLRLKVKAGTQ